MQPGRGFFRRPRPGINLLRHIHTRSERCETARDGRIIRDIQRQGIYPSSTHLFESNQTKPDAGVPGCLPFAYFNFCECRNHAGFQRRRRAERQGATAETMAGGASALAHDLPSNMLPPAEQNSAGITTGGSTLWLRMPSLASLACTPAARLSPFHPKLPNGSGSRRWRGRLC